MTPRDREFIAALCAASAGLWIDPDKAYLMESRLGPAARREGFASVAALVAAVRDREEERLIQGVVEAMVLPETCFFRDREVFQAIAQDLLPSLARRREGESVRVWSAGCGPGQEIYSLAMMLDEGRAAGLAVELFASDLSERLLEKAQRGVYTQFEVQRGLSARRLVRHFERQDNAFELSPRVRQLVRWRRVNLLDDLGRLGGFDLILCRNVLSSLTAAASERVLQSLRDRLRPGGYLVLGAGETARDMLFSDGSTAPGVYAAGAAVRAAA